MTNVGKEKEAVTPKTSVRLGKPLGRICYVCSQELYAEDDPVTCEDCGTLAHTGCSTTVDDGDTIVCLTCLEKGATYAD